MELGNEIFCLSDVIYSLIPDFTTLLILVGCELKMFAEENTLDLRKAQNLQKQFKSKFKIASFPIFFSPDLILHKTISLFRKTLPSE